MKNKTFLITTAMALALVACNQTPAAVEKIAINGDLEVTVEVKTEYVEAGVTYPEDKYQLVTTGFVNTNYLGKYELTYSLYTSEGELYKELHRFVNVVDTTAPTYFEATTSEFYVGISYNLTDFVTSYSDNYYSNSEITVSKDTFLYTTPGQYDISISFTDRSNNISTYSKTINVELDVVKLLEYIYGNRPSIVTTGTNGIGKDYTRVQINNMDSFTYYHGSSMHYLKEVTTSLGRYASIQISAEYGKFDNADLSYHISGSGSAYSTGFASIDATQESVTVSSFRSTINNLNLNVNDMLVELNNNLPEAISSFHSYFKNTLHLDLK